MKKLILLIGLLTYSSVGWSEELVMKCTVENNPLHLEFGPDWIGVFKMDTNQPSDTEKLIFVRKKGKWRTICPQGFLKTKCEKGPKSVFIKTDKGEILLDFVVETISVLGKPRLGENQFEKDGKCKRLSN